MKTIIQSLLFSLVLTAHAGMAQDFWVKGNEHSRYFITIDQDSGVRVNLYFQEKGDYQDKILSQSFLNLSAAKAFIAKRFEDYAPATILKPWPVNTNAYDKKNRELWTAKNQWDERWERQYANWLQSEINADFYLKYNIPTDCADALIGFRWIFARTYSLPVANTLADTGALFGHFSMRKQWDNLPTAPNWYDDKLFLTSLNYIMDMTSTRTIMNNDGLPVAITQKGLLAGTFIVSQTNGSGHIRTITQNYFEASGILPLFTHSSTSPRELRGLYKEAFVDQAWPLKRTREILAFRWPVIYRNSWVLSEKKSDARYSEEQFNTSLQGKYYSFIQFVLERVKKDYDPSSLITTGIEDLVNFTNMRIEIVRNGYEYCLTHDCRPGSQGYEDWSTPSRDAKYILKFNEIESLVKNFDPAYPGLYGQWMATLESTQVSVEGQAVSLARLRFLFEKKWASSNPIDPILKRWGLNQP